MPLDTDLTSYHLIQERLDLELFCHESLLCVFGVEDSSLTLYLPLTYNFSFACLNRCDTTSLGITPLGPIPLGPIPLGPTPLAMTLLVTTPPDITLRVFYCSSDLRYVFSLSHHSPSLLPAFSGFDSHTRVLYLSADHLIQVSEYILGFPRPTPLAF